MNQGLVHIYCGDGKGKTTAALGLALRASGHNQRVLLVQFLKSSPSGELTALKQLPSVTVLRPKPVSRFARQMTPEERSLTLSVQQKCLREALQSAIGGECDVLILDEVLPSINKGLLDGEVLWEFLRSRPPGIEVVLTGRKPEERLLALADYVTEMKKIKHPYDRGVAARDGIEK